MERPRNTLVRLNINLINIIDEQIKEYNHQLYAKMQKSVEKRGQLKNIVVCETEDGRFDCLDGSKMVKIFKDIGQTHIVAYNLGVLSHEEKNIVRIELSRDYFLTNYVYIGTLLKESLKAHKIEEICNILPFDKRQVEHLVSMSDFDWEAFNQTKQVEGQKSIFDLYDEEPVEESKKGIFEDFVFPTDLDKLTDESLPVNDGSDLDEIFDKKSIQAMSENGEKLHFDEERGLMTEGPTESVEPEETSIVFEIASSKRKPSLMSAFDEEEEQFPPTQLFIMDEGNEQRVTTYRDGTIEVEHINKPIETETGLKLSNGEIVNEGEEVMFETRKGISKILITKISDKWVVFKDLDEDGKRKDCQVDKFVEKASKKREESIEKIEENTQSIIETVSEPEIESTIEVHTELQEQETIEQEDWEEIFESNNESKPFYYDEEKQIIVIKKYADEILDNLESLAKSHWKKSLKLFDEYFEGGEFKPSFTKNENETIITHVVFVSKYNVTMRVVLSQLVEMLNAINFEK